MKRNLIDFFKGWNLPHGRRAPLTRVRLFHLKNLMFETNFLANLAAVLVINHLIFKGGPSPSSESLQVINAAEAIFTPGAFILIGLFMLLYERPIRRFLNDLAAGRPSTPELDLKARQRLLNEPILMVIVDLGTWLAAAFLFGLFYWALGERPLTIIRVVFVNVNTGLITSAIVFFTMEHIVHTHVTQYLFPQGGVSGVPGTFRIRISTRLAGLIAAANVIPLTTFIQMVYASTRTDTPPGETLDMLRNAILSNSILFIVVGLVAAMFVGQCLTFAMREVIRVLNRVREGDFDQWVRVSSNDEIGYTGEVINEMTAGLKERDRLRQSLLLAREVQQNLLPQKPPSVDGLDLCGRSIYCDETGGDYFDYIPVGENGAGGWGLVVGDVSDHGVQASLVMVSARATLRHHLKHSDDLAEIVGDLNRHLCEDARESGNFMSLFFAWIDPNRRVIRWVNAGHEPALLYDPRDDSFSPLTGRGPALGVLPDFPYEVGERLLEPGTVLIMATDGIWEARGPEGDEFGRENLRRAVRENRDRTAVEILEGVLGRLDGFCRSGEYLDDVTLMVAKVS